MPRLLFDPNLAQCPDYNLNIWEPTRTPLINPTTDHAQAAVVLTNIWNAQNAVERQQWQAQLDQDAAEAEARRDEVEEQERLRQEEIDREKEEQRKEEEKKNAIKYAPIPDRDVPTRPPVIASAVATRRLEKGEYVPLWYYTNAGLEDATRSFNIVDEEALSLIRREDGSTSLVPSLTSKESKAVIEDKFLSWEEFSIAAPRMIDAMSRARWPNDRIKMTANFWSNLTVHPFRSSGNQLDKNTLLLYQGEQRKLWHQAISSPGHGYDLSRINEQLLSQTKDRLYWKERERIDAERDNIVSDTIIVTILNTTNLYSPLLFPLLNYPTFAVTNAGHDFSTLCSTLASPPIVPGPATIATYDTRFTMHASRYIHTSFI
ncbi:hypothetical protein PILCRDRAFT_93218 [Piloderma croceum F 1598]|uniref:Uncharacterized protein n=1 Tax=Piloderma croceum (strain F 1598) TaxID=765440 RepID=A0A0C3AGZ3_PILCF|nr:hypothetical protein PILCRDRAFT_93218 [Piloderma croceum F 1598]